MLAVKELRNRLQQRLQAHALPHQLDIRKADLPRRRSRHGSTLLALRCADPRALQSLDIAWASLHQQVLGPFSSRHECLSKDIQETNGLIPSKVHQRPN